MKKEELSIGNLVKYKNSIYIVKSIRRTDVCLERGNNSIYIAPCNIDAIPISHNWLKNLGFKFNKEETEKYHQYFSEPINYYNHPIITRNWNFIYYKESNILIVEDDPILTMKYVHQVQNVLTIINVAINVDMNGLKHL